MLATSTHQYSYIGKGKVETCVFIDYYSYLFRNIPHFTEKNCEAPISLNYKDAAIPTGLVMFTTFATSSTISFKLFHYSLV